MSIRRWNPRADANQVAVMAALRAVGAMVWRLSEPSLPDLLVGFRKQWFLLEVKRALGVRGGESKQKKTPAQEKFFAVTQKYPVALVRSPEEALAAIGCQARFVAPDGSAL